MEDFHTLAWREGETPPTGRFQLFAGLYDPASACLCWTPPASLSAIRCCWASSTCHNSGID